MRRSKALELIANQLDFLNGAFSGYRDNFTKEELAKADVLLTTLEQAGFEPPNVTLDELFPNSGLKTAEGITKHYFNLYEPEEDGTHAIITKEML